MLRQAHSGKHNKRVGKLIASKAGATLEATRSARHDGKFSGVKRESKRGGSGASGTRRQHCRSGGKRDRKRCNRDKHSRWAAAAAAAIEQLSSHGQHGDKRGDRQDKRGGRRGKRGDQRGQQDTHGDRVTRAAASEA